MFRSSMEAVVSGLVLALGTTSAWAEDHVVLPTSSTTASAASTQPNVARMPAVQQVAFEPFSEQPTSPLQEQGILPNDPDSDTPVAPPPPQMSGPGDGQSSALQEEGIMPNDPDMLHQRISALEDAAKKGAAPIFPNFRLSGFAQLDAAQFSQSPSSKAALSDIQDGTGFRRARLGASGNLTEMTKFFLEMDFATVGRPSFTDVWGEQSDLPFFDNIRIGQYRQPITLDAATSIRHLDFLERTTVFSALDPFRRVGIAAWRLSEDEMTFINYSVYSTGTTFYNGTNPNNGTTVYGSEGGDNRYATTLSDGGVSFAIRATHLLWWDEPAEGRYFFHVGGGYNFSQVGGSGDVGPGARTFQARTVPEIFVGDPASGGTTAGGTPNVIDTGRFLANNFSIYHVETCGQYGPAHFQGEYLATVVKQRGGPLVFLDGAYLQGGYFLTGENIGYNKSMGAADYNVKPYSSFFGLGHDRRIGGWGAWEVASRVSYLNLNGNILSSNQLALPAGAGPDQAGNPNPFAVIPGGGGINQGRLIDVTMGLNWWWNANTRMQFNYIYSMANTNNGGDGGATVFGTATPVSYGFNSMSIFAGRFQVEF